MSCWGYFLHFLFTLFDWRCCLGLGEAWSWAFLLFRLFVSVNGRLFFFDTLLLLCHQTIEVILIRDSERCNWARLNFFNFRVYLWLDILVVLLLNGLLSKWRGNCLSEWRGRYWSCWRAVCSRSHATTYWCGLARWLSVNLITSWLCWSSARSHTSWCSSKYGSRSTTLTHASTCSRSRSCWPYSHVSLIFSFRFNYLLKYISVLNFTGNFFLLKRQQEIKL